MGFQGFPIQVTIAKIDSFMVPILITISISFFLYLYLNLSLFLFPCFFLATYLISFSLSFFYLFIYLCLFVSVFCRYLPLDISQSLSLPYLMIFVRCLLNMYLSPSLNFSKYIFITLLQYKQCHLLIFSQVPSSYLFFFSFYLGTIYIFIYPFLFLSLFLS